MVSKVTGSLRSVMGARKIALLILSVCGILIYSACGGGGGGGNWGGGGGFACVVCCSACPACTSCGFGYSGNYASDSFCCGGNCTGCTAQACSSLYGAAYGGTYPDCYLLPYAPRNTGAPAISGTVSIGSSLSTSNGSWDANPAVSGYSYQWQRGTTNISGATGTSYTVTSADYNNTLRSCVTATNNQGSTTSCSASTSTVPGTAPSGSTPTISGTLSVSQTLTANAGSWSGVPSPSLSYQWQSCTASSGGTCTNRGTGSTYTLQEADSGTFMQVTVTGTNVVSSASVTSTRTGQILRAPTISGSIGAPTGTVRVDQTLTSQVGSWTANPAVSSYSYQWQRCDTSTGTNCVTISGATSSTYTLVAADSTKFIRTQVTASNGVSPSGSATSATTSAILQLPTLSGTISSPTGVQKTGSTLTAQNGTWTGNPASFTYTYQWQRCDAAGSGCVNISSATGSTYNLVNADQTKFIRAQVTATNTQGSTSANSSSTGAITDGIAPTLALQQASGQADPTNTSPINFTLSSDENLDPATITSEDFTISNGSFSSRSPSTSASSYTISVTPSGQGAVSIAPSGAFSVSDVAGNAQVAASGTDRSVVFDSVAPSLTLEQAPDQTDPAGVTPVKFRLAANEPLQASSVSSGDFTFAGGTYASRSPSTNSDTFTISASPSANGAVCAAASASFAIQDIAGNTQNTLPAGTDRCVHYGAPTMGTAPALSGLEKVGETLSVSQGSWQGGPAALTYSYQWQRCDADGSNCQDVSGRDGATYALEDADTGKRVRARVSASNAIGENSFATDATGKILRAPLNTALPAITGISAVGDALGASSGDWTAEPEPNVTYQWERCSGDDCQDISGATSPNYAPVEGDIGAELRVRVRAENSEGSQTVYSQRTSQIGKRPTNDSPPSVSGNFTEGAELTGSTGDWSGFPALAVSIQWERCLSTGDNCSDIPGANTLSYTTTDADVGKKLRLRIRATNIYGVVSAWSTLSETVRGAPFNTALPSITGSLTAGSILQSDAGVWRASPSPTFALQWQRCSEDVCTDIPGATGATYTLGDDDPGKTIRLRVISSNTEGSTTAYSAQTSVALGPPRLLTDPVIEGSPKAGDTLQSTPGSWAGHPAPSIAYRWLLCQADGTGCANIDGATASTYAPTAAQSGKRLRLRVTATNSEGVVEKLTAITAIIRSAPVNYALPTIDGRPAEGEFLTALVGSWHAYPEIDFAYLWQSCSGGTCQDIPGETSSSYMPTIEDSGKTLRVRVQATNAEGTASVWSAESIPVFGRPQNLALPTITGSPVVGGNLTANAGSWKGQPAPDFTYQWERCENNACENIAQATGLQYSPAPADSGKKLRIRVRATNSEGSLQQISALTGLVLEAPQSTALPEISGPTRVGSTVSSTTGSWRGYPAPSFERQWQRCQDSVCVNISGQTGETYTLGQEDEGKRIRVQVRATNGSGTGTALSAYSARVSGPPRSLQAPAITGTLAVSGTLLVSNGTWGGYPAPDFSYQWQRCDTETGPCVDISQATGSSYLLRDQDEGSFIRVIVRASNDLGEAQATSDRSAAVLPDVKTAPANSTLPVISGLARVGSTLQANSGMWSAFPEATYSYRWQVSGGDGSWDNIPDAGEASYTIGGDYTGQIIRVRVRAANEAGIAYASSAATQQVERSPFNISAPGISGQALPGETIQASAGRWSAFPDPTYSYQWQRSLDGTEWANISGATTPSYVVLQSDRGKLIRVRVQASNSVAGGTTGEAFSRAAGISDLVVLRDDPFLYSLVFDDLHSVNGLTSADVQMAGTNGFVPGGQDYSPLGDCQPLLPGGLLVSDWIAPDAEISVGIDCQSDFGSFAPRLRANAVVDEAGNSGPMVAATGEEVIVDRVKPKVEWRSVPKNPTAERPFTYYISFDDEYPVSGLQNSSFSNVAAPQQSPIGMLQPLQGCSFSVPSEYLGAYTINPGQQIPLTIDCPGEAGAFQPGMSAGAVIDQAGNSLAASSGPAIEVDRLGPSISWTESPTSPRKDTTFSYKLTIEDHSSAFNLDAEDFDFAGNLPNIDRCRITSEIPGEVSGGDIVTISVTCPQPGSGEYQLWPVLRANSFEDFSGNLGPAADVSGPTILFDYDAPTGGSLTVNNQAATVAGSSSVSGEATFPLTRTNYTDPSGPVQNVLSLKMATLEEGVCSSEWADANFQDQNPQEVTESACYRYILKATDALENTITIFTTVRVDLTPPGVSINIEEATGNTFVKNKDVYFAAVDGKSGTFKIRASATEDATLIEKAVFPLITDMSGGGEDLLAPFVDTYTWSGASPSAFGPQEVRVFNSMGLSGEDSFELIRDTDDPTASWVDAQNNETASCTSANPPVDIDGQAWYRSDVTCSWRVSDAVSGIKGAQLQSLEGQDWQNIDFNLDPSASSFNEKRGSVTVTKEGANNTIRLRGEDNVGLESPWSEKVIRIDRTAPVDNSNIGEAYLNDFRLVAYTENGVEYPGILKFSGDNATVSDALSGIDAAATRCWQRLPNTPGAGTEYTALGEGCRSPITEDMEVRYQIFDRAGNSRNSGWKRVNVQDSLIEWVAPTGSTSRGDWTDTDYVQLQAKVPSAQESPLGVDYITVEDVQYEPSAGGAPITTDAQLADLLDGNGDPLRWDCTGDILCNPQPIEVELYSEGQRTITFRAYGEPDPFGRREVSELPAPGDQDAFEQGMIEVNIDSTEPKFENNAGLAGGMSAKVISSNAGSWSSLKPSPIWRSESASARNYFVSVEAPSKDPNLALIGQNGQPLRDETGNALYQPGSGSVKAALYSCNYESRTCRRWGVGENWQPIIPEGSTASAQSIAPPGMPAEECNTDMQADSNVACYFNVNKVLPQAGSWLVAGQLQDQVGNETLLPNRKGALMPSRNNPDYLRGITRSGAGNPFCAID